MMDEALTAEPPYLEEGEDNNEDEDDICEEGRVGVRKNNNNNGGGGSKGVGQGGQKSSKGQGSNVILTHRVLELIQNSMG